MRRQELCRVFLLVMLFGSTTAFTEDYDYEVSLGYAESSYDSSANSDLGIGLPIILNSSNDRDVFRLDGIWYFNGLSDNDGPRSRAAFLNRASSLSFGYSRDDSSSSFVDNSPNPFTSNLDGTSDAYALGLRYVNRESGWIGLAGVSTIDGDVAGEINGTPFSDGFSGTGYNIGLGKYLGEATSASFTVAWSDTNDSDLTQYTLALNRVGSLGTSWQYGADVDVTFSDNSNDDGRYGLRISLFPSNDVEFGAALTYQKFGSVDNTSYEGFISWFVQSNVELVGFYRQEDPEASPGQSIDSDSIGVGVSVRF